MMLGLGIGISLAAAARAQIFDPVGLFSSGEPGIWLDPSDLMTLYQDSAGTVPVTAAGQPVGRILDKSGRGNHATQPVASRRPTLGRHPVGGRRNLLTYTEQFDNAAWVRFGAPSVTAGTGFFTVSDTQGSTTSFIRQAITLSGMHTASVVVRKKSGSGQTSRLALGNISASGINFNAATGAFSHNATSGSVVSISDTEWLVTVSGAMGDNFLSIVPAFRPAGEENLHSPNNSATGSIDVVIAQLEVGSTATAYQRVVSPYDVTEAGKADCWYLETDGVDDFLVTPTITPGTDKAQVFAGVRAIGTATGIVVENGDASTTNGTFALASPNAYLNLTHWSEMRGSARLFSDTGTFPTIGPPRTDVVSFLYDIGGATPAAEMLPRLNGESKTLNVPAPPDNSAGTGNFLAYPLYIGGRGGTIYFFKGNLYGLAVRFGPNLDEATIAKTEAWLNTKTGAY